MSVRVRVYVGANVCGVSVTSGRTHVCMYMCLRTISQRLVSTRRLRVFLCVFVPSASALSALGPPTCHLVSFVATESLQRFRVRVDKAVRRVAGTASIIFSVCRRW